MIRILILFILLIGAQSLFAQDLLGLKDKTLVYEALFIEPNGDTLTTEKVEFQFTPKPWTFKGQQVLKIRYFTDTIGIQKFIQPFEKVRKKYEKNQLKREQKKRGWENWTWLEKEEETGYKLNDSVFWLHPPRGNQYLYNEISGMPQVDLNQLFIGGHWKAKLMIMMGYYDFKGTVESSFKVVGKTKYKYKNFLVPDIWEIEVLNTHSKLGQYKSRIIFDEKQFGFLQFDNSFHDGRRIVLSLMEIQTTPNTKYE